MSRWDVCRRVQRQNLWLSTTRVNVLLRRTTPLSSPLLGTSSSSTRMYEVLHCRRLESQRWPSRSTSHHLACESPRVGPACHCQSYTSIFPYFHLSSTISLGLPFGAVTKSNHESYYNYLVLFSTPHSFNTCSRMVSKCFNYGHVDTSITSSLPSASAVWGYMERCHAR